VGLVDYSKLPTNFHLSGNGLSTLWQHGNSDGDLTDYNVLASNFSPAGYEVVAVPEPGSIVLIIARFLPAAGVGYRRH
jgi:hypothetical protein